MLVALEPHQIQAERNECGKPDDVVGEVDPAEGPGEVAF